MAKQRPSSQKRDREFRKRERERKKRKKAALKRERRHGDESVVEPPASDDIQIDPASDRRSGEQGAS